MIVVGINESYKFENDTREEIEFFELEGARLMSTAYMFKNCKNLKRLISGNINTFYVKTAEGMFAGCTSLTEIDLSNFNFSSCKDFRFMFDGCENLQTVKFGRHYIDILAEVDFMFRGCKNLEYIAIPYECKQLYENIIGQSEWRVKYYNKDDKFCG